MATTSPVSDRPHRAAKRYIYAWGGGRAEGDATMRDLLGGKGAGLAEMTNAGLPVPPGFTISTDVCSLYYKQKGKIPASVDAQITENIRKLEKAAGATLGSTENPLLVSVRSGAKFSMPGMMDTILNLGLNDKAVEGLKARTAKILAPGATPSSRSRDTMAPAIAVPCECARASVPVASKRSAMEPDSSL